MLNKIHICNWLLTRKCNLKCSYCGIAREPLNFGYPNLKHYYDNEMTTDYILTMLNSLKLHNPDMFHIFYGGEPFLRKDLYKIINFCNENEIHYTIISNCSPEIMPLIDECFSKVEYIQGFTASIDPPNNKEYDVDEVKKSETGKQKLLKYKGIVKDLVAEITVSNQNKHSLYDLVCELSKHNITSDITFVDIAKTDFYDFSNVFQENNLVKFNNELLLIFAKLIENKDLKIHMKDTLLTEMLKYTDSSYDCKMEDNLSNICIDADGTLRTCLRIKGTSLPIAKDLICNDSTISNKILEMLITDKKLYCQGCNWPCVMMSNMLSKNEQLKTTLIHEEERK